MEKGNQKLHLIDRYIGIPIVMILGLFRINKKKPENITKIAVMKTASIGDTVLMSGVLKDLRRSFHDAHITFFIASTNYELSLTIEAYDDLVKLNLKNIYKTIITIRKKGKFDVFIDYGAWPRLDAILTFFAKANYKIGFYTPHQYKHYIYDHSVLMSKEIHELDNFRNLTKVIANISGSKPNLNIVHKIQLDKFNIEDSNYIVFHPWPSGFKAYLKEWPNENWVYIAKELIKKNHKIVITGAKKDIVNTQALLKLIDDNINIENLAGRLSLTETMSLIKHSKLLVSVNTGIMHIGAAFNIPLVALHGPTNVKRWGPISENHINIYPESDVCGYLNLGFEYPKNPPECMEMIHKKEVLDAIFKLLS